MFIRHFRDGKTNKATEATEQLAHWDYYLVRLLNVFASIFEAKSWDRGDAILREMYCAAYPMIMKVIAKDFSYLTGKGTVCENGRVVVAKMIGSFAIDPNMKRYGNFMLFLCIQIVLMSPNFPTSSSMYGKNTLKVLLQCWLFIPFSHPSRDAALYPVFAMFDLQTNVRKAEDVVAPADYLQITFKEFRISMFVSQVKENLKKSKSLGMSLDKELCVIALFVQAKEPVFRALTESEMHKNVALAMRRQLKQSNAEDTNEVLYTGGSFLQRMLIETDSEKKMQLFTELLSKTCLIDLAAAAIMLSNSTGSEKLGEPFYEILEMILHSVKCKNDGG
ncbi:hypothetical protein BDN70DRAFT_934553 [Pholiota conissans]|uniref:Uncharacterized protein n=1 Tax=Pholiota conissans TaxID=109636 RepID=A0A9P5YXK7_9AGAR|nr:hypothetical protein BDN70DRAFT_934553 [Pholiota conissans]